MSIEAHKTWVLYGRPHLGVGNDSRLLFKARYKAAIRKARNEFCKQLSDKMASKLLSGNQKSFWAAWNNNFHANSRYNATCNSSLSNDSDIVQGFFNSFSQNSFDSAINASLKVRFVPMYDKYVSSAAHNDFVEYSVQEADNAILQLKRRKAADAALLTAEHVIYANHIYTV